MKKNGEPKASARSVHILLKNLVKDPVNEDKTINLTEASRNLILESLTLVTMHVYMDFISHLNEHEVTWDIFPEVWEVIAAKVIEESGDLTIQHLHLLIYYIS